MERRSTRRELMVGAVAAAGVGAALAPDASLADTPAPSDAQLLTDSLAVERVMVLAYRRVLASGLLTPDVQRAIAPHLDHEIAHVAELAAQLTALGVPAPTGPVDLQTAAATMAKHHVPASLTDLHTATDCLKLLVDLESAAEGVHFTALKDLRRAELMRLSAQIMACEAQHWTVLSGLRNPGQWVKAVPWPFVYGSK